MSREPLWLRLARRPHWERGDPLKPSDLMPTVPLRIVINTARAAVKQAIDVEARLTALEREQAARGGTGK